MPLINSSITDCVFEVKTSTSAKEVNAMLQVICSPKPICNFTYGRLFLLISRPEGFSPLQDAASTYLEGILGFEQQPLVSTDYVNDRR